MVRRRKLTKVAIVLLLLGIPLLLLRANSRTPSARNIIDRALLRICAPVDRAISGFGSTLSGKWRRYIHLVGVQESNEILVRENRVLRGHVQRAERDHLRLLRYEQLLAFRGRSKFETVAARVIAYPSSPFDKVLRIHIEANSSNIRIGAPVITPIGVVGRITARAGSYAEVRLVVDPLSSIDVYVRGSGARGLLKGISEGDQYLCQVRYMLHKADVKVGDLVLTSGAAGVFPRGLPVGRVVAAKPVRPSLYQKVEVAPVSDPVELEEVLVVVSKMHLENFPLSSSEEQVSEAP